MLSDELKTLLVSVITSWQVIAVTVFFVLYCALVSYVSKSHKKNKMIARIKSSAKEKAEKFKKKAPAPLVEDEEEE
jgi:uncharacterized membrane protein